MRQNTRLTRLSVLLALTLLAGGTTPAARVLDAGQQMPFKGTSSGVVRLLSVDPQAGLGMFRIDGTGQATLLGRFTVTGDIMVDLATGSATGNWTLTAADGGMLILSMVGHGIDPTHGFGALTVVGGTGRFENATGYYEQVITFAVPIGSANVISYTDVFTGSISSHN